MSKKVFLEFPTPEMLDKRSRIITAVLVFLPIACIAFFETMLFIDPDFLDGRFFGDDVDRMGMMHGEAVFLGVAIPWAFIFGSLCIMHLVYYMLGYDAPDDQDLKEAKLKHDDAHYTMLTTKNFSASGVYMACMGVVAIVLLIVQGLLSALWHIHSAAALLPAVVVAGVLGVRCVRARTRQRKLEEQEIVERLKGTHQAS